MNSDLNEIIAFCNKQIKNCKTMEKASRSAMEKVGNDRAVKTWKKSLSLWNYIKNMAEARIPKKPVLSEDGHYRCATCDRIVPKGNKKVSPARVCNHCYQVQDWKGVEV